MRRRRFLGGRHAAHRSGDVHGQRQHPELSDLPGQQDSDQSHSPDLAAAARVLSRAEHVGTARDSITSPSRIARSTRKQFTQRMDFVQNAASTWMGRYSYGHDDEVTPALKLNGTKLLNSVHQVMIGNTRTLSPTVLNEFRFGFNSFFNTFGRELAFERDVVSELAHSRHQSRTARVVGHSGHRHLRVQRLRRQHGRACTPTGTRCSSSSTTCPGSTARTRSSWAASIRFDQFNQDGNQFSRGSFQFDGRATGSFTGTRDAGSGGVCRFPARLSASLGSGRSRSRPRGSARSARRTTSTTRGACART